MLATLLQWAYRLALLNTSAKALDKAGMYVFSTQILFVVHCMSTLKPTSIWSVKHKIPLILVGKPASGPAVWLLSEFG